MTRQELIVLRMNMLGGMNEYVQCFNDEEAYYNNWIYLVPDECTEDDLESIAEDDESFNDVCILFGKLIKAYGDDLWVKK